MRSIFSLKLAACVLLVGAGLFAGCTVEEGTDTGGAAGSTAGSGGDAGSGGSKAGAGGEAQGGAGGEAQGGAGQGGEAQGGEGGEAQGGEGGEAQGGEGGEAQGGEGGEAQGGAGGEAQGGAGGEAQGGAGGEAQGGAGSGGGEQGTDAYVRIANLVVGYKAKAIDICTKPSSAPDWSGSVPLFGNSGEGNSADQFFAPTVSVWFEAQELGNIDFRFVAADAKDCNTKVSDKIEDFSTNIAAGNSYTIILSGDSGSGGSNKPIKLYSLLEPAGDPGFASIAYFNGIVNVPTGVNMGVYDTTDKKFYPALSEGKTAIKYAEGDAILTEEVENNFGLQRADNKTVLAVTPNSFNFKKGGHYTVLATGTNEFAEKGSNNLPWIIVCDDDSNETVPDTTLVANCVYSQGPQLGVK